MNTASLGTNGILPATSGTSFFLGDYPVAEGVYLNPA